jgi:hypothetical protein
MATPVAAFQLAGYWGGGASNYYLTGLDRLIFYTDNAAGVTIAPLTPTPTITPTYTVTLTATLTATITQTPVCTATITPIISYVPTPPAIGTRLVGFKILFTDGTYVSPIMIDDKNFWIWKNEFYIYGITQHNGVTIIPLYE